MEFRFKAGSVFCYFKGLYRLLDKKRTNNHYNKVLFSMFTNLEQQVYKFYGEKIPRTRTVNQMDNKKPKIITIASIKDGVGKSASAIILATLLSKDNKVLLIDRIHRLQ